MLNKILATGCVFLFIICISVRSQLTHAGYGESYLKRDVGARAIGLAGAYTSITNDPFCIFYNPAGLSFLAPRATIVTSLSIMEFGRTHDFISWGQSFGNIGVGISFNNFNNSNITSRDIRGNYTGVFTNVQYTLAGGFAYSSEFASIGTSLKYLANSMGKDGIKGDGFALDLGMRFDVLDLFSYGISLQNITGFMNWNTLNEIKEIIPYTIRSGIAMEFPINNDISVFRSTVDGDLDTMFIPASRYILISMDAIYHQFELHPYIVLGIEAVLHELISIRVGSAVLSENLGKMSILPFNIWGAGISLRPQIENFPVSFQLDYSIGSDYISSYKAAHHFSVNFQF